MRAITIIGLFALTACVDPPALVGEITPQAAAAPFPTLQPLAPLLARAQTPGRVTPEVTSGLTNNAARLRARAAALRGPVIAPTTRARMQRGVR